MHNSLLTKTYLPEDLGENLFSSAESVNELVDWTYSDIHTVAEYEHRLTVA